jgi:predicted RNase H-like nuclease (RuvC/YqgF family)
MNEDQLSLEIQGQSLSRIYDNFVAQVSGIGEHKAGTLSEIVELEKRISAMEKEVDVLQKKMRKEPQYDIQIKMNKQVKAKRQELEQLKKQLEELK